MYFFFLREQLGVIYISYAIFFDFKKRVGA